jgi:hypothetical protein
MPVLRATLPAFALALLAVLASSAQAFEDDPVRNVTINGKPPSQTPDANILVRMVSGNPGNECCRVLIYNNGPEESDLLITSWDVQLASGQILEFSSKASGCRVSGQSAFHCEVGGLGIDTTASENIGLNMSGQNYTGGIVSINLVVNDPCAGGRRSVGARAAAKKCVLDLPPGTPKITRYGLQGSMAGFEYKASGALSYSCQLLGPGKKKGKPTTCGARKVYSGLKPGSYQFAVRGVNKKGRSKTAATKKFVIR